MSDGAKRILKITILILACFFYGNSHDVLAAQPDGPGNYFRLMDYHTGGFQRRYRFHLPPGYQPGRPLPLVIALHGAFSSGKQMAHRTGLNRLADRENFMVLYPEGIGLFGFLQHWNAGHCCGKAWRDNIDDLGFIKAALGEVSADIAVDRRRLYLVGYSNGGMMAHRLAAAMPRSFAAVAVVAGTVGSRARDDAPYILTPHPHGSVPMIIIHGRKDDHIPYEGGRSAKGNRAASYASVKESAGFWVRNNQGGGISERRSTNGYTREVWCRNGTVSPVEVHTMDNWGHDWPGPGSDSATGVSPGIDAAEIIWRFFEKHRRP